MKTSKSFLSLLLSTTGKKYIVALTGLALVGFVITHLLANLLLLLPVGTLYNQYAHKLFELGWLLYVAEAGLAAMFLIHIVTAVSISVRNQRARPVGYSATKSRLAKTKNGPSKFTWGSTHMIFTGGFLAVFLVIHVWQLRLGPGIEEGYRDVTDTVVMRDLYSLVYQTFSNEIFVGMYLMSMLFLGFHLRHGFWSLFQSLGVAYPRWTKCLYQAAFLFAAVIAGGFALIPIWIYFGIGKMIPRSFWEFLL